jgi:hypothetical protein
MNNLFIFYFNPVHHYKMIVDMSRLQFGYVGCDGVYFIMKDVFVSLLMNVDSLTILTDSMEQSPS